MSHPSEYCDTCGQLFGNSQSDTPIDNAFPAINEWTGGVCSECGDQVDVIISGNKGGLIAAYKSCWGDVLKSIRSIPSVPWEMAGSSGYSD